MVRCNRLTDGGDPFVGFYPTSSPVLCARHDGRLGQVKQNSCAIYGTKSPSPALVLCERLLLALEHSTM